MFLNKKIAVLAVAAATVPAASFAASGNTINFQGEVTTQTCSVTVNGTAASPTVLLKTVPANALSAAGSVAGATNFTVGVSGCTAGAQQLRTVFVGNQVDSDGNLGNTGTATGVALQLFDPATPATPFNLSGTSGYAATGLSLAAGATSATHDFAVQYYSSKGGVAAGSVLGSVQYAISYQ